MTTELTPAQRHEELADDLWDTCVTLHKGFAEYDCVKAGQSIAAHVAQEVAELQAENKRLRDALEYAVSKYGKDGGPWNVPSDPGGWITRARAALNQEKA